MIKLLWLAAALTYVRPELVVTTDWVAEHVDDPNVRIVDASRDKNNPPTFLPDLDTFVDTIEGLGISSDTHIVFYDDRGGIYGTRPWVLLRMLGHEKASIVDGGWPKWIAEERPVTSEQVEFDRGSFDVRQNDQ